MADHATEAFSNIGHQWVPQVPAATAVREAIGTLDGIAVLRGEERRLAIRVGGDRKGIWLDLGRADWKAVRISTEGWKVVSGADIAFVRPSTMLQLPEPKRGGSIKSLQRVVNVQPAEFVLAVGWLLQALNPVGPYPIIDAHGPSEAGKTATCKTLLRVIDPTSVELRQARKTDDLLIAARNNWALGFDNLSYLSWDWSDTLCMLATGISSGTRKHYTNDEEHVFTVQRLVPFNGIPVDLTERSDLASRTIKLEIVPLKVRRTEADLAEEFAEAWPKVLGALLDGLVGALSGYQMIEVPEPARLMDFERFAEAGCRAMGFAEWEFVDAYAANRHGSIVISVEASAVGRAVTAFLKKHPKGFTGQMSVLYDKLETYKANASWRVWPKSPTKLSTELRRLTKPLAAINVTCCTDVDRRADGGT